MSENILRLPFRIPNERWDTSSIDSWRQTIVEGLEKLSDASITPKETFILVAKNDFYLFQSKAASLLGELDRSNETPVPVPNQPDWSYWLIKQDGKELNSVYFNSSFNVRKLFDFIDILVSCGIKPTDVQSLLVKFS